MDNEKLNLLRSKIAIPLTTAVKLLKQNNNDVELSIQTFHKNNINTICRLAECDDAVAEKYYALCKFDIEKTILKIHEQLCYLTVTPDEPVDKIGFIIWAENDSLDQYASSRDRSLFIQTKDFEYIIESIRSMYPIYDPENKMYDTDFDITSYNIFYNATMRKIVEKIAGIETTDTNLELFLRELIKWLKTRLRYADKIVIYGNL